MVLIKFIEFAFYILTCYKILKCKGQENAFYWFVYGCIVLYPMTYIIPSIPLPTVVLPVFCILRSLIDGKFSQEWKRYPFRIIMVLMVLYHIIHPFIVSWMPLFECMKMEFFGFFQTFTVLLGGYLLAPANYDRKKLERNIIYISIILIISGSLCWILSSNFIAAAFSASGDSYFGSDRVGTERGFRATGTQFSPNSYGNALVLCILLINHYCKKLALKYFTIGLLLLCIVFTASRTPLIILVIGICIYYLFQKKSKLLGAVVVIGISFYLFGEQLAKNEYIGKYIGGVTDLILTGGENTSGSSSDLRERQWFITLYYLEEAPFFGHGEGYTMQLVNENGIFYVLKDSDLAGAEGYQYIVLIDHGICYAILALIFFGSIFWFFTLNLKGKDTKESAKWGLCLTSCLFIFLLSSRPNQVWQIYCPFIALYLKNIISIRTKRLSPRVISTEL